MAVLPPLVSATDLLETFLLSPEYLPIHDLRLSQRLWQREIQPELLLHVGTCPAHTDISVDRDLLTGELLGYHEIELTSAGLTAKNSTSLQRAPGPFADAVKGDATNYPFWPGGFKEPEMVEAVTQNVENFNFSFEEDLLTVPPGFVEGIVFKQGKEPSIPDAIPPPQAISIAELMSADEWLVAAVSSEEEEEVDGITSSLVAQPDQLSTVDESLSAVLSDSGPRQENLKVNVGSAADHEQWVVKVDLNKPVHNFHEKIPRMAITFPFELDPFQKQAILHLHNQDCVFVAAHTSAGKTVVAEYAIALSLEHKTRTVYTSPIKALSNQKFREFRNRFGSDKVGLLTGDVQIKQESPCLIMTTEILRSMLYGGSDTIRDLEWVIFDEVHYVNDSERGVVWEEVLIMLPAHVNIIMLSATVPNAVEFADWVGRTKRKKVYVISTFKRPVPLVHHLYTGNNKQTSDQLFVIVGEDHKFNSKSYQEALDAKKKRASSASEYGPKSRQYVNPKEEKNIWLSLVHMLEKKEKLPVVAFTFSRDRCNGNADALVSLDLTTSTEKHEIDSFFQKSIQLLKGSDQSLPQVVWMKEHLKRGIAVHHSGILPIVKEVIELLFQKGLVKLLFATETFAMGVNMPARTVVFDAMQKHDGTRKRDLNPGEYVQMAGRAGRRGLDTTGTVILLCKGDVPEASDLHRMILGHQTSLQSQFRLTYSMLLNLIRVKTLRVEDMMKRSFAEAEFLRSETDRHKNLEALQRNIENFRDLDCPICDPEMDDYFKACSRITQLRNKMQHLLLGSPQVAKALVPGRVVTLYLNSYKYTLAVILELNTRSPATPFTVLTLCKEIDEPEEAAKALVESGNLSVVKPCQPMTELFHPDGVVKHTVVDISGQLIVNITDVVLTVEPSRMIDDYKKRQIPRFRNDAPGPAIANCTHALLKMVDSGPSRLSFLDPVNDLRISNLEFVEMKQELDKLEGTMQHYGCTICPQFTEHFAIAKEKSELHHQRQQLMFLSSEESLLLIPEYRQRVEVLKSLGFVSDRGTVMLKGRVACEIHYHEVILTELIFQNVLDEFEPQEIVALLSCFVFEQSSCSEPNIPKKLQKGKDSVLRVAARIAEAERSCGMRTSVEEYQAQFKFGLLEVVYEWARGKEFIDIINLTDVSEGIIVRCIQRLDETCKDVRNAAHVIGEPTLRQKMMDASALIKRDIVFAASLYTK
eukprot:Em0016g438a